MGVADRIRERLEAALAPQALDVIDESHRHAGHAGARPGGESHFHLVIVSDAFTGKSRLERQRLVYAALADELAAGLHALSMATRAPTEVP